MLNVSWNCILRLVLENWWYDARGRCCLYQSRKGECYPPIARQVVSSKNLETAYDNPSKLVPRWMNQTLDSSTRWKVLTLLKGKRGKYEIISFGLFLVCAIPCLSSNTEKRISWSLFVRAPCEGGIWTGASGVVLFLTPPIYYFNTIVLKKPPCSLRGSRNSHINLKKRDLHRKILWKSNGLYYSKWYVDINLVFPIRSRLY